MLLKKKKNSHRVPLSSGFDVLLTLWQIFAIFKVFAKFAVSVKIATIKGDHDHVIWLWGTICPLIGTFANLGKSLPFVLFSSILKDPFAISFDFLIRLWRMFAKFVIFAKFSIFAKIATVKRTLCYLPRIFDKLSKLSFQTDFSRIFSTCLVSRVFYELILCPAPRLLASSVG